jgi:hypothetical protein
MNESGYCTPAVRPPFRVVPQEIYDRPIHGGEWKNLQSIRRERRGGMEYV